MVNNCWSTGEQPHPFLYLGFRPYSTLTRRGYVVGLIDLARAVPLLKEVRVARKQLGATDLKVLAYRDRFGEGFTCLWWSETATLRQEYIRLVRVHFVENPLFEADFSRFLLSFSLRIRMPNDIRRLPLDLDAQTRHYRKRLSVITSGSGQSVGNLLRLRHGEL